MVVQSNLLNQTGHPSTLISPITSRLSESENSLRVRLDTSGTGLESLSEVLVDQVGALDNRRFLEKIGKLNNEKAMELKEKLGAVVDF